jgi:hypothetical protein
MTKLIGVAVVVFLVVTPCGIIGGYQCFGETCCLLLRVKECRGKKEVGLEVNTDKTKYMLLSRHQNAGQIHNIKIGDRSFEGVMQFMYLGMTVTNQKLIYEKITRRLNLGNACHHSVQNVLSSCLLSENVKIRIYKSIILPVVLYFCIGVKLGL